MGEDDDPALPVRRESRQNIGQLNRISHRRHVSKGVCDEHRCMLLQQVDHPTELRRVPFRARDPRTEGDLSFDVSHGHGALERRTSRCGARLQICTAPQ